MIRFVNGKYVFNIVTDDVLADRNILNDAERDKFKEECELSLVRTKFTNDRNEKVQTTEWVVTHIPTGETFTHSLRSFIYDRTFENGEDTKIEVGDVFCVSRCVEGQETPKEWGELIMGENGHIAIKELNPVQFEEMVKNREGFNVIY